MNAVHELKRKKESYPVKRSWEGTSRSGKANECRKIFDI